MKAIRGRPEYVPTEELRALVTARRESGKTLADVAGELCISIGTLLKYYREELDAAEPHITDRVRGFLFKNCEEGNVQAQIFWLKTRGGWKDTMHIEHSGTVNHRVDPDKLTREQRHQLESILTIADSGESANVDSQG